MGKVTLDLTTWKEVLESDDGWTQLQQSPLNDILDAQMTEPCQVRTKAT